MSAFKHHPKLYLPYGDLVIASAPDASEESTVTLFRVSKGILAYNSSVFADMLTFPTGNSKNDSVNEMHEGAPVVRVTDTAQELEAMLKVLYEPAALVLPRLDPNTPLVVRDVLKLASKYQMSAIRKAIVEILEDTWPHTFYGWLRYQADLRMAEQTHFLAGGRIDGKSLDERFPEPASAVRLAHDCDVPRILPFAYYELAVALTNEDWDTIRRDEELARDDLTRRTARWGMLGRDELWRVIRGREELSVEVAALKVWFKHMGPPDKPECATPNECSAKFKAFASERIDDDALWMMYDALNLLEVLYNRAKETGMCDRCRSAVMAAVRERERLVWDELPELFGLPDWNEVEP